jgi:hypothetical protein
LQLRTYAAETRRLHSGPSATHVPFDNNTGIPYAWFNSGGASTSSWHGTIDATTAGISQISSAEGRYRMAIRNKCSIFTDGFEA